MHSGQSMDFPGAAAEGPDRTMAPQLASMLLYVPSYFHGYTEAGDMDTTQIYQESFIYSYLWLSVPLSTLSREFVYIFANLGPVFYLQLPPQLITFERNNKVLAVNKAFITI